MSCFITRSAAETESLGEKLGNKTGPGFVIALTGDLGAGKTSITRGIARACGYTGRVTSPTFTIVNEYRGGKITLLHFDMYRLRSSEELYDIGWEDYLGENALIAAEWADITSDAMPGSTVWVSIRRVDDTTREINIRGVEL